MMESLFVRTQVRGLLYTVNDDSDSEYELLLLIQIPHSYMLNLIIHEASTLVKWHVRRNY